MKSILKTAVVAGLCNVLCIQVADAEKLCLKVTFNKKKSTVATAKKMAAACPKDFVELVDTSELVGPQGPAGPQGNKGDPGATGAQGEKGDTGTIGTQGPKGDNGELAVYGDGSGGALNVASSAVFSQGNAQYTDVTINSGVTLVVYSGTTIRCTGTFTNNGTIDVLSSANGGFLFFNGTSNIPAVNEAGGGVAVAPPAVGEIGAGNVFGGFGGYGISSIFAPALLRNGLVGGGGGAGGFEINNSGGNGGGFFAVYAKGAIVNGGGAAINADGSNGAFGGGGGAGGVIVLASQTSVANSGNITVRGGEGGSSTAQTAAGGGGGGGLIHMIAPTVTLGTVIATGGGPGDTSTSVTVTPRAGGGGGGASYGNGGNGGGVGTSPPGSGSQGAALSSTIDPTSRLL